VDWVVENFLTEMPQRAAVGVEGRTVQLRAWKYEAAGSGGYQVPVYFLDTDLPDNSDWDKTITHFLYGGDQYYRLCQEIVLGIGGVRMLRALGYRSIERFHMNEGHSSLLALELLDESAREAGRAAVTYDDVERVRRKCVFTTHTTVAAGHDQFPVDLVMRFGPAGNLSHERCLLLRGLSQFDLFGFESEPLCQWRRQKIQGNLPADVFRLFRWLVD